jgi:hypothetical protein
MSALFMSEKIGQKEIQKRFVQSVACVSCNKCFAAAANFMPVYCYNKGFPKLTIKINGF